MISNLTVAYEKLKCKNNATNGHYWRRTVKKRRNNPTLSKEQEALPPLSVCLYYVTQKMQCNMQLKNNSGFFAIHE